MEIIKKYFTLTERQEQQFAALGILYPEWNAKINLISRKDIDCLYEHHILHSLAIAKYIHFADSTSIMDLGTGGGFPGIPLAILFPACHFTLVDSIGKKVRVAQDIAQAIDLQNVTCRWERVEEEKETFDFIVSRAVMPLNDMLKICRKNISKEQHNALPNGIITLKGGDLQAEAKPYRNLADITPLSNFFTEEYFKTKKILYLPL